MPAASQESKLGPLDWNIGAANDQQWPTSDELRQTHKTTVRPEGLGLYGIGTEPPFAIGQRALLVTPPQGNFLGDCIPLLDDGPVGMVKGIGRSRPSPFHTRTTTRAWLNGAGPSTVRSFYRLPTGGG
jgi:hypothetical protein